MIYVDLHVHTKFSGDSSLSPKLVVEQLRAHPFIKGMAITDHNTFQGYHHVHKLARAYNDILIIPGIEVSTTQGDIIVLGVEEEPLRSTSVWDVVDFAYERAGVVIAPHPYRMWGIGDLIRKLQVDAVEVFNPWSTPAQNRMAEQVAKELGLPCVAGSDAHRFDQMWTACTEMKAELSVDEALSAIRKGGVRPLRLI